MTEFPVTFPASYAMPAFTVPCLYRDGEFWMPGASIAERVWIKPPPRMLETIKEHYAAHQINEQARAQSEHQG